MSFSYSPGDSFYAQFLMVMFGCVRTTAQTPEELQFVQIWLNVLLPELETKLWEPTDLLLNAILKRRGFKFIGDKHIVFL